ncbi:MAG: trigger factor, partial [Actinobacteria bacterium]|nr:trigger factor [Actinomycetota bacterium]
MKATLEPVPDTPDLEPKVKLVVQIDESELEPAIAAAWKEIAREVRIPGFRPGKAPRALMEKQLGTGYARSEALNRALPEFYSDAVISNDVDVIAQPELDITDGRDEGDVTFTAIVGIRPTVVVAGYGGLRIEVPSPDVPDEELDEQIDRLRAQYGELETVDHPAGEGDYVTIDIHGSQGGEEVDGLTADDYLYAVGSGMIASEFDEHLTGAKVGDILEFSAQPPDPDEDEVEFRLLVKEVKERVLPELTDEWVAEASEFETVEELRNDTRGRLAETRERQTRAAVRTRAGNELAKLVDEDIPESLIATEMQLRLQNMMMRLQQQGVGLDDYLRVTGQDPEEFTASLRSAAEEGVKVDLAIRAVVAAEGLEASDDEVDEVVAGMIGDAELTLEEAREQLRSNGQLSAVRSDIAADKAIEWLVEHAEVVDPDGAPIDEQYLRPVDHDHDHDHD